MVPSVSIHEFLDPMLFLTVLTSSFPPFSHLSSLLPSLPIAPCSSLGTKDYWVLVGTFCLVYKGLFCIGVQASGVVMIEVILGVAIWSYLYWLFHSLVFRESVVTVGSLVDSAFCSGWVEETLEMG